MDNPEFVTHEDRRIMIGILANFTSAFCGDANQQHGADSFADQMTTRFRADLARDLGHAPTDQECFQQIDDQIERLRYSLGEFD